MEANERLAESSEREVRSLIDEDDEAFMNAHELQALIERKTTVTQTKRQDVLFEQDKLLWDLSLAFKRCLVAERGATTMAGVQISHISVQSVLDRAEAEDPQPQDWTNWIQDKFLQE
jgi:hypothetical protein